MRRLLSLLVLAPWRCWGQAAVHFRSLARRVRLSSSAESEIVLMIGCLTLVLLRFGSFIMITAVPVTPLVLFTLRSAPRLAGKESQRQNLNQ